MLYYFYSCFPPVNKMSDKGATTENGSVLVTEEFHHMSLHIENKGKDDDFSSEEMSFEIERTVKLDRNELTAPQRHKKVVNDFIKSHLEFVPEFQDTTLLSGHLNNLNSVEMIKLQLLWVLLLKVLSKPPPVDFDKFQQKQKVAFCKDLFKQLHFHLPRDNFDLEGNCKFENDLEVLNYCLNPENLCERFFKVSSLDQLVERIEENPISKEFFNKFGCDDPDTLLLRFLRARKWNLIDHFRN